MVGDHQHSEQYGGEQPGQCPEPHGRRYLTQPRDLDGRRASRQRGDGGIDDHKHRRFRIVGTDTRTPDHDHVAGDSGDHCSEQSGDEGEQQPIDYARQDQAGQCPDDDSYNQDDQQARRRHVSPLWRLRCVRAIMPEAAPARDPDLRSKAPRGTDTHWTATLSRSMSRTVYVNGSFVPEAEAKISVFDRAFLFADGVYEVTAVLAGRPIDLLGHLDRLDRSLGEIEIQAPLSRNELVGLHEELIRRNRVEEGVVYLEITRGVADRDFLYPDNTRPTVVAFTQSRPLLDNAYARSGVKVVTIPDLRWRRRDIKSTSLLAQVMGKQEAKRRGAYEAWMVEDGVVTEGTSSTAFILDEAGILRTRPLGHQILPGVTRRAVLRLAKAIGSRVEERPFSVEEAKKARESFLTAASAFVLPVVEVDGVPIGDGKPGPVAGEFRRLYVEEACKT